MPLDSWPYINQAINANQYSWLHRTFQTLDGIAGGFGSPDFVVSADSTGLVVKVGTGRALIRGYMAHTPEMLEVELERADPQPRIDRVVLRLDIAAPAYEDRVTLAVLKGVPAATNPEPPGLTRTDLGVFEIPLARVAVGAGVVTIRPADVADERHYIGTTYGAWTSSTRPEEPWLGQGGFNASTGRSERWNGYEWMNDSGLSVPTKADLDIRFPAARPGLTVWIDAEYGLYVRAAGQWRVLWTRIGARNLQLTTPRPIPSGSAATLLTGWTSAAGDAPADAQRIKYSGGVLTVPVDGVYSLSAVVTLPGGASGAGYLAVTIVDATMTRTFARCVVGQIANVYTCGACSAAGVYLSAGSGVAVKVEQSAGVERSTHTNGVSFSVAYLGGQ